VNSTLRVRQSAVAGLFYPGQSAQLIGAVRSLLDAAAA